MMNIKAFQKSAEGYNFFFLKFLKNGVNPYAEIVQKAPSLSPEDLSLRFVLLFLIFLTKYEKTGSCATRFTLIAEKVISGIPQYNFQSWRHGVGLGGGRGVCKLVVFKSIQFEQKKDLIIHTLRRWS